MSFLFDLIGGGDPFRGQMGATIHFLEEEKGGPQTETQTHGIAVY